MGRNPMNRSRGTRLTGIQVETDFKCLSNQVSRGAEKETWDESGSTTLAVQDRFHFINQPPAAINPLDLRQSAEPDVMAQCEYV